MADWLEFHSGLIPIFPCNNQRQQGWWTLNCWWISKCNGEAHLLRLKGRNHCNNVITRAGKRSKSYLHTHLSSLPDGHVVNLLCNSINVVQKSFRSPAFSDCIKILNSAFFSLFHQMLIFCWGYYFTEGKSFISKFSSSKTQRENSSDGFLS